MPDDKTPFVRCPSQVGLENEVRGWLQPTPPQGGVTDTGLFLGNCGNGNVNARAAEFEKPSASASGGILVPSKVSVSVNLEMYVRQPRGFINLCSKAEVKSLPDVRHESVESFVACY